MAWVKRASLSSAIHTVRTICKYFPITICAGEINVTFSSPVICTTIVFRSYFVLSIGVALRWMYRLPVNNSRYTTTLNLWLHHPWFIRHVCLLGLWFTVTTHEELQPVWNLIRPDSENFSSFRLPIIPWSSRKNAHGKPTCRTCWVQLANHPFPCSMKHTPLEPKLHPRNTGTVLNVETSGLTSGGDTRRYPRDLTEQCKTRLASCIL